MATKHIHYNVEVWRRRVEFCERHLPNFSKTSHQDDNHGEHRLRMFTILTQHIYGNSVTELIDKGIRAEEEEKNRIEPKLRLGICQ